MNVHATIQKLTAFLLCCFISTGLLYSQTGVWSWVSGDNTLSNAGVYGTKGVASASNKPGYREGAVSWTDASGNFWLFGGEDRTYQNDLWKYSPAANTWTWVSGDNTAGSAVYGVKGVASVANKPGGRWSAKGWIDANGNLWLFGGIDTRGNLNDLWKYSPAANTWTWVSGDNTADNLGVYGTKGVANAANKPPMRYFAATCIDASGNLWLFGGFTGHSGIGQLNDLWKYSPSANMWTWVSGDNTAINASTATTTGVYGTKGVASVANKPGARGGAFGWTDAGGNVWLFGGSDPRGNLNDLWKYSPAANTWTWVSGDNTATNTGVYGTKGVANAANKPGGRFSAVGGKDVNGNLLIFDGDFNQNDLWKYSPAANTWTWVSGDNVPGATDVYGTKGVPDAANKPAGRRLPTGSTDASGNFWLFGGRGRNDLWKFVYCPGGTGTINPKTAVLCPGSSIQLNATAGGDSYQWYRNDAPVAGATSASYSANDFGIYKVLILKGACTAMAIDSAVVKVNPALTSKADNIVHVSCTTPSGSATITATGGTAPYSYSLDGGSFVAGNKFDQLAPGNHKVTVKDNVGCTIDLNFSINQTNSTLTAKAEDIVHTTCTSATGSVTITGTGGTAPYSYSLEGGSFGAGNKFDKLAPGTHKVTVKDSAGCMVDVNFVINQSNSTLTAKVEGVVHATCTVATGSATTTATGGIAPYSYRLDGGSFGAGNKFDKLVPGAHKVSVKDSLGCMVDVNFDINQPNSTLTAKAEDIIHATCTVATGSATITATAGMAPYSYRLDGGSFGAGNKFDKLPPGNHKVTVKDSVGCTVDLNFDINQPNSTLTAKVVDIVNSSCTAATGAATITATGGIAPYSYRLDGGIFGTVNIFDKLAPGNHKVTVKDNVGCTVDLTLPRITSTNPGVTYSAVIVPPGKPYAISARPNIGNTYLWSPSNGISDPTSRAPTVTTSTDQTYNVTITAASGCTTIDTQEVRVGKLPTGRDSAVIFVPTAFTPNNNGMNDRLKPIPYSIDALTSFKVYNRWGQMVFETKIIGEGWDGTLKGKPQPMETYIWILECTVGAKKIRQSGRSILIR